MTFKTFMNSIGNAFKTGWNNGNIQKGMKIAGATAFGVGAIGAMAHEMKNGSIFGSCCNGGGMFGGCGMNPFGMSMEMNPYGMMGFGMGMSPYEMMGAGNMFDSMGMLNNYNMMGTNPYLTQIGQQRAFEWGRNLAMEQSLSMQLGGSFNMYNTELTDEQLEKIAPTRDNEKMSANPNADTKLGVKFDKEITSLLKDKDAEAVKLSESKFTNDNKADYLANLKKLAESCIANVGSNGTITEDDYIDHEIEKYKELNPNVELTDQIETRLRNQIKMAFAKLDLNKDGEIDKNEMTSALATFDTGGKAIGTSDLANGEISATDYKSAYNSLMANDKTFANNNWSNYQQLFGAQDT